MREQLSIEQNKFYTVYYEQRWYVGRIDEISNGTNYTMTFLRRFRNSEKLFVWPKKPDVTTVEKEYIFFGPIEFNSEEPFSLDDVQYEKICNAYDMMK